MTANFVSATLICCSLHQVESVGGGVWAEWLSTLCLLVHSAECLWSSLKNKPQIFAFVFSLLLTACLYVLRQAQKQAVTGWAVGAIVKS